jgi:transposase
MSTHYTYADMCPGPCPGCRHEGPLRRHAMRPSWWRDVPESGKPKVRRGHIVRWRCTACAQTYSCPPEWALPGKRLTRELSRWILQALQAGQSVRAVARLCGVDDKTVRTWAGGCGRNEADQR